MLCLLTIIMVFLNFTLSTKATDYDLSQYISQVALEYEKDGSYIAYDQSALADQTKLRFNITAALPKSSLVVNNSIRLTMPDHLALEDTVAPVSAIYSYAGENHDYSHDGPIGSYTVKDHQMTVTINNPQDDTLYVYLQINTTINQLTFTNNEVTLAFSAPSTTITIKKAAETAGAQTNETQTTPKTVKRAPLKANSNTDAPNKISGNINDLVKSGLSGSYQLVDKTTVNDNIGKTININNDVTIDLNGNKLQLYSGTYFYIKSGKHLTIIDSKADYYKPTTNADNPTATNAAGVGNPSSLTTEKDSQDDRNIPSILNYYVTEPNVNSKTTTDTTKKYTVDFSQAGRIYSETSGTGGEDSTFMIEKGGTLDFESGVAYNNTGPHVVATHGSNGSGTGTLNLSGGYLIGNRSSNVIWNNAGNVLNISGGVITNGCADNGGGIYNNGTNNGATGGGTINMTGGIITGNEAYHDGIDSVNNRFSGGGIYMKSGILNISGNAYITNNRKSEGISANNHFSVHGGGGVAADNDSQVNMSGGYVTGNYSNEAGGGLYIGYFSQGGFANLTLTGGIIASNVAQTGEGGGIRIGGSGRGDISAVKSSNTIYITNNKTYTGLNEGTYGTGDWGGGGIFVQENGQLNIRNAIITENHADGFGGGVSACPTGNTSINTDQGAAIYSNTANGEHYSRGSGAGTENKNEDYAAYKYYKNNNNTNYQDYFLAHKASVGSYTIKNGMLGGGSEGYKGTFKDGQSYEQHYNADGVEAKFIGLSAVPSDADKEKALKAASTYISGNQSHNHGGGIMTNGMLTLGESNEIYPSFHVEAYKAFKLKSALDNTDTNLPMDNNQFKFAIYKHTGDSTTLPQWDGNEFTAGSGTNEFVAEMGNEDADKDQLGRIYASIPNFLYDNAGDYTFYLVEKDSDDTSITYDHTIYKIQFTVYASGTKTVNNVETTTYSIKDVKVKHIVNGNENSVDYTFNNSNLTLFNNAKEAFKNTEQSYGLQITKKDAENSRVLAGAEFKLYQFDDNYEDTSINSIDIREVKTLTKNEDGKLTFNSLRGENLYYLKETKAPDQYQSSGPWVIKVNKDGTANFYDADCTENESTTTLTRNNSHTFVKEGNVLNLVNLGKNDNVFITEITDTSIKYKLPDTGGSGIEQFYQAAFVLIALGLLVILVHYIKRRVVE